MSDTATEVIKRYDELKSERGAWESHWSEIAERVIPRYHETMQTPDSGLTKGNKRTERMIDSTAATALERFAAALEAMLTPRSQKWHHVRPSDPVLAKDHAVKLWFEDTTDRLFKLRYAPSANFASQQHEVYMGLGAYGTGLMYTDSHDEGGFRYRATDLREVLIQLNHQGILDTSYRKFNISARNMKQKVDAGRWSTIPDAVESVLKNTPDKLFEVIHCIRPREEVEPGRLDARGMQFASFYVAVESQQVVSEGGFNTFPYQASRYVTGPGEVYGRSPAMMALPAIKVLNEQKKTMLAQGHRAVAPVLLSHDDGVIDTFSMKPGHVNPGGVSAEGRQLVHALPVGDLAAGQELMDMERSVINDVFLVTLFQILVETPTMTATEVLERAREKGALLSPSMGRQQSEGLGPMIMREIDIAQQQNLLEPMPSLLIEAQGEFDIIYDSPLSRSQRAEEAAGWMRTLEAAVAYANTTQDLGVLDHFDTDTIYPALAEINAMPPSWMASPEQVEEKRASRQQAAGTQQAIEAAPAAAGVMKALSSG
tara:strand:+ start:554 stop:2176 length:1623 start_codon:yes stop_codon:yes gene_type:complete